MRIATTFFILLAAGCAADDLATSSVAQGARGTNEPPEDPPDDPSDDPPPDDPPPPPPPQPAPPPAQQGTLVRITAAELQDALMLALGGSVLSLDTTETSPPIPSEPFWQCAYPNQGGREAAEKECREQYSGQNLLDCLAAVEVDWPNVPECNWTTGPEHSYLKFGGVVRSKGAVDVPFGDIEPMYRDSWGPGGVTIGVNHVRTTAGYQTLTAGIIPLSGQKPWLMATAWIALKFTSNQPTLTCTHDYFGCPDLNLNDIRLEVHLHGIGPNPANNTQLAFISVVPYFSFTRNLTNVPDWLINPFYDVDQLIKSRVNANVVRALNLASSRAALNNALTELVRVQASMENGSRGVERIYNAWYESNWTLVVDYKPCPLTGCPTTM